MKTTIINSHKVENFTKWKQGFDASADMRSTLGINIIGVFQSVDDENYVTIISEMPNKEMALAVMSNPELKAAGQKAGVTSVPEIKILSQVK